MSTEDLNPVTITHLGPYEPTEITNEILAMVKYDGVPVVVKQQRCDGVDSYAVLSGKELKVVCVGCFRRDMRITDRTRCKQCASFVKHWDMKDGGRRLECKTDSDSVGLDSSNTRRVIIQTEGAVVAATALEPAVAELTDEELLDAIKERALGEEVVMSMTEEAFAAAAKRKYGVTSFLRDAKLSELIHELRRQTCGSGMDCKAYYSDEKLDDLPHKSDSVATRLEYNTKGGDKRKFECTHMSACVYGGIPQVERDNSKVAPWDKPPKTQKTR